jgi:hypothetical protein
MNEVQRLEQALQVTEKMWRQEKQRADLYLSIIESKRVCRECRPASGFQCVGCGKAG